MHQELRLHKGQTALTRAQEAEARRFADERVRAQFSAERVDEQEAEDWLRRAYQVAGLAPPTAIHWVDGPFQLVMVLLPISIWHSVGNWVEASIWKDVGDIVEASVWKRVWNNVESSAWKSVSDDVELSTWFPIADRAPHVWYTVSDSFEHRVRHSVVGSIMEDLRLRVHYSGESDARQSIPTGVWERIVDSIQARAWDSAWAKIWSRIRVLCSKYGVTADIAVALLDIVGMSALETVLDTIHEGIRHSLDSSLRAYLYAEEMAVYRFFDTYLAPNALHALARFNELVSGYWLGQDVAVIVRRPKLLELDEEGRLHSATGPCIEYHDGWRFYAWHGVKVPEQVILAPEELTRWHFLDDALSVEVRRVIQERMGERFVPELGGVVVDEGPHGTLYEVPLPDDPERVARYVQVRDASTPRQYSLRVPPTIQTAAEAVAWSFGLSVEEYQPKQET